MSVVACLLFGLPLFLWGLTQNDHRAPRGLAGAEAWAAAWLLGLVLVEARRRASRRDPPPRWTSAWGMALVVLVWALFLGPLIASRAGDFGMDPNPFAWVLVLLLVPWVAVAARLAGPLRRALGLPRERPPVAASFPALVVSALPWLLPMLALAMLRMLPVAERWQGDLSGLGTAGILFMQLETVAWPGVLIVAWGVDVLCGDVSRRLHGPVLALSIAALVVTAVVPVVVEPEGSMLVRVRQPDGTREVVLGDFDALVRGASAMLAACAGLTGWCLRRLARGRSTLGVVEAAALFVVAVGGTWYGVPRAGPEAAPWSVAVACLAAWALLAVRTRGEASDAPALLS